jgi:hypothetical protein
VVEYYDDVGSRLEAYKREGFQRLLKRVERGDIDWVAVECLDRFGVRSSAELGKFICHLQDHNVKLYCISEGLEATSDDAFTTLTTTISGLRSTDELKSRAHRSLKGRLKSFRNGTHSGGQCPYGFALSCTDTLGVELWRLEMIGPNQRVQVLPDGQKREFNGPRNSPRKNEAETLRLVPSLYSERQEWVHKCFTWWCNEDISYRAIATRLNDLGVDALNGKGWSGPRVQVLLSQPAYVVGACVGNKRGQGKVLGWKDGQEVGVERVAGRTGRTVKRDPSDYVWPDEPGTGIVDPEVWDAAQRKLNSKPNRAKTSRNPDAYLSSLLICDGCNCKLVGHHKKNRLTYICASHRAYKTACNCGINRVAHTFIEKLLLDKYFEEAELKLNLINQDPINALRSLQLMAWSRSRDYLGTLREMEQCLREAGVLITMEIDGQDYDCADIRAEYRSLHQARQEAQAAQIQVKEEELRGLVRNLGKLSSDLAIELAQQEVERLGQELDELKRVAQPLDEQLDAHRQAIRDALDRVRKGREALAGAEPRQKAEAIRKVVRAVRLAFEKVPGAGPHEATTRLVRVVIVPLEGDDLTIVPSESPACPA